MNTQYYLGGSKIPNPTIDIVGYNNYMNKLRQGINPLVPKLQQIAAQTSRTYGRSSSNSTRSSISSENAKALADYYNAQQKANEAAAKDAAEKASNVADYNNPDQTNSLADLLLNWGGWTSKGFGNMLKEYWNYSPVHQLLKGNGDTAFNNGMSAFSEDLDILANPFKTILQADSATGMFEELKSTVGLSDAYGIGARKNHDWDTGNKAADFALEIFSDPLTLIEGATGLAVKAGVRTAVKEGTEATLKRTCSDLLTKATKAGVKDFSVKDIQKGYEFVTDSLGKNVARTIKDGSTIVTPEITAKALEKAKLLTTFKFMTPEEFNVVETLIAEVSKTADLGLIDDVTSGLAKIYRGADKIDNTLLHVGLTDLGVLPTVKLIKYVEPLAKVSHIKLNRATTKANKFNTHWTDVEKAAQQKVGINSIPAVDLTSVLDIYKSEIGVDKTKDIADYQIQKIFDNFTGKDGVLTKLTTSFRTAKNDADINKAIEDMLNFCKANGCKNFYEYKTQAFEQVRSVCKEYDINNKTAERILNSIDDTYEGLIRLYTNTNAEDNIKRIYKELTFGDDAAADIISSNADRAHSLKNFTDSIMGIDTLRFTNSTSTQYIGALKEKLKALVDDEDYAELEQLLTRVEDVNKALDIMPDTHTMDLLDDASSDFKMKLCDLSDKAEDVVFNDTVINKTKTYGVSTTKLPAEDAAYLIDDSLKSELKSLQNPPKVLIKDDPNALTKMSELRYFIKRAVNKSLDATEARSKINIENYDAKVDVTQADRLRNETYNPKAPNKNNDVSSKAKSAYPDMDEEAAATIIKAIKRVTYGASTNEEANTVFSKIAELLYSDNAAKLAECTRKELMLDLADPANMATVLNKIKDGALEASVVYKPSNLKTILGEYDKEQIKIYKLQPSRLNSTTVINELVRFTDKKHMDDIHNVFNALKELPDAEKSGVLPFVETAQLYTKQWMLYLDLQDKISEVLAMEDLPARVGEYILDSLSNHYLANTSAVTIQKVIDDTIKYFNTYASNLHIHLKSNSLDSVFDVIEREYTSIIQNTIIASKAKFTPSYNNILYAVKEVAAYCNSSVKNFNVNLSDVYRLESTDSTAVTQLYTTLKRYSDIIDDYKESLDIADKQIRFGSRNNESLANKYMIEYINDGKHYALSKQGKPTLVSDIASARGYDQKMFDNNSLFEYVRQATKGQLAFKTQYYDDIFIKGVNNIEFKDMKDTIKKLISGSTQYTAKAVDNAAWLLKDLSTPVQYNSAFIDLIQHTHPDLLSSYSKVYDALIQYVKDNNIAVREAWTTFNLHALDDEISDIGWYTIAKKLYNTLTFAEHHSSSRKEIYNVLRYLNTACDIPAADKTLLLEVLKNPNHMLSGVPAFNNTQCLKDILELAEDDYTAFCTAADKEMSDNLKGLGDSEQFVNGAATALGKDEADKLFTLHDELKDIITNLESYTKLDSALKKHDELKHIKDNLQADINKAKANLKKYTELGDTEACDVIKENIADMQTRLTDSKKDLREYNTALFNKSEAARLGNVLVKIKEAPEEIKRMLVNDTCGFMVLSDNFDTAGKSVVEDTLLNYKESLAEYGISYYKLSDEADYVMYLSKKTEAMPKASEVFDASPDELSFVKDLSEYGVQGSMTSTRYTRYADVQKFYDGLPDELKNLMAYKPDDFNVATSFNWGNLNFDNTFIGRDDLISNARRDKNPMKNFSFSSNVINSVQYMAGTYLNNNSLFNAATLLYYSPASRITMNSAFAKMSDEDILNAFKKKRDCCFVYFKDGRKGKLDPVVVQPTTLAEIKELRKIDPIIVNNVEAHELLASAHNSIARQSMGMELLCTISSLLKASWLSTPGFVMRNFTSTFTKAVLDAGSAGLSVPEMYKVFHESRAQIKYYEEFYADLTKYAIENNSGNITNDLIEKFFKAADDNADLAKYKGRLDETKEIKEWLDHGYTDTLSAVLKEQEKAGVIKGDTLKAALANREERLQTRFAYMYDKLPDGTLTLNPKYKAEHDRHAAAMLVTDFAWKNPYTRLLTTQLNGPIETYARYFTYNVHRINGSTKSQAAQAVKDIHFDYAPVTDADELLNTVIPFVNFKMANTKFWLELIYNTPLLAKAITATYKVNGAYDMSPEAKISEEGYLSQLLSGAIPIGDTGVTFKLNGDYIDALKVALNPVDAVTDSVLGLKTIKQWVKYKDGMATANKELQDAQTMRNVYGSVLSDDIKAQLDKRIEAANKQVEYYGTVFNNLTLSLIPFANRIPGMIKAHNYVAAEFADIADDNNLTEYITASLPMASSIFGTHTEKYYYSWGNLNVVSKDYEKYITALEQKDASTGWAGVSQDIQEPVTYYSVMFNNGTELFTKDTEKLSSWLSKGAYPTNDDAKLYAAGFDYDQTQNKKLYAAYKNSLSTPRTIRPYTPKPGQHHNMNWPTYNSTKVSTSASTSAKISGRTYIKANTYSNPAQYGGYNRVRSFNTNNYRKGF